MRVIALQDFRDLKADTTRKEGEVFVVSKERYAEIMAYRPDLVKPCEDGKKAKE